MKHIFFIHPENKRSKLKKEEAQLAVAFLQPGPLVSLFLFCMTYRNRNCQNGRIFNHPNVYQGKTSFSRRGNVQYIKNCPVYVTLSASS